MKKYNLGVVLSGGSVRGSAHLGFLKRLEELHHKPEIIAGTSAGAMIGAFYAAGKSFEEILNFFKTTPLFRYNSINPLKIGIFDTDKYESVIKDFLPNTFEELEIPLVICATNVLNGQATYFSSGDLHRALLASCAIPLIFAPVEINGVPYIDGGVLDNFPVEQIQHKCHNIIGSYLGNPGIVDKNEINSKLKITTRANQLLMYSAAKYKFEKTNFTLEYQLQEYGYFDQKKMEEIYNVGYDFASKHIKAEVLFEAN